MDMEVTIKYRVPNFCTKKEIGNKSAKEFFLEIYSHFEDISLWSDKSEIVKVKIVDEK